MGAIEHYGKEQQTFSAQSLNVPAWVADRRTQGLKRFDALGLPTRKQEAWKYTNVKALDQLDFGLASQPDVSVQAVERYRTMIPARFDDPRLVFVDGVLVEALSSTTRAPRGVRIGRLQDALRDLEEELGENIPDDHPFAALNTAFLGTGAYIHVPAHTRVNETVQLVYLTTGQGHHCHPRNIIHVGNGARLNLVEAYIGRKGAYFNNVVTEVVTGSNATVRHYKVQNESADAYHVAYTRTDIGRDSRYLSQSVSFGAALCRNDLFVNLPYPGAECVLNGLFVGSGSQHVDNHTTIDHQVPHCDSNELYKGILLDEAHGVFDGRIVVREDAQKTTAQQHNKNLLLSRKAIADSKPQLEIFADDVKCAHGTAIGQLDDGAIYYLRSRGLSESDARGLMTHAFAGEVVETMELECTRNYVDELLWNRIPHGIRPDELDARICLPALMRK